MRRLMAPNPLAATSPETPPMVLHRQRFGAVAGYRRECFLDPSSIVDSVFQGFVALRN